MTDKNAANQQRKERLLWTPYYMRVTKNKKVYTRKVKHKKHFNIFY